jgi:dCTP deaminase
MMLGPTELKDRLSSRDVNSSLQLVIVPTPTSTGSSDNGAAAIDLRLGRWFLSLQQSRTSEIDFNEPQDVSN